MPSGPAGPAVSVIVNTLDRAEALAVLLDGLTRVTYRDLEVVVVVGPCTDHTDEVLSRWEGAVRVLRCPEANLSMSRNIGIAAAACEFVAFIDDDAVPEPAWLDELMAGFDGDEVGEVAGVGGWVWDHTGHALQCRHTGADRLGNARPDYPLVLDRLSFPGSRVFPYAPGGNAVYRRDALVSVGGFDEEYQYYLEETDLCVRLIDRGWLVRQVDGGAIHHKFLPSGIRTSTKVLRDRYAVIKNKVYFSLVNGLADHSLTDVLADDAEFCQHHRNDARWHLEQGNMTAEEAERSLASIDRGWTAGLAAGLRGRVALGFPDGATTEVEVPRGPYLAFPVRPLPARRRRVCLVTQTLPPTVIGGIGRYFLDLARELAERGHEVHIVTSAEEHSTVDLEHGVWVHRIRKDAAAGLEAADLPILRGEDLVVPDRLADNALAVLAEVRRIAERQPLDAVYAAMWDVEQLEVLRRSDIPVVTALVTTFAITLRTRPEWAANEEFMTHFGTPLLELERWVAGHSAVLHAISEAVRTDVEATSGVALDDDRVVVAPIGAVDRFSDVADRGEHADPCTVLFVGRFEKRKGVDLVLAAVPELLTAVPDARVVMVGRTDLAGESGRPYAEEFLEAHEGAAWADRLDIRGEVDDDELWQLYRRAGVLVAPSRFESFGLIYVEAMMAGVPVVAVDAGAAPEVVDRDVTGVLVPADAAALAAAMVELATDPERRAQLGAAGRARYLERFSVARMADSALEILGAAGAVAAL